MPARSNYTVAVHEAGHAVACLASSIPFTEMGICDPDCPTCRGYVQTLEVGIKPDDRLVMIAAGCLAERRVGGGKGWETGVETDWRDWCEGVRSLAVQTRRTAGAVAEELYARTQRLVRTRWSAIAVLADALVRHRELSSSEARSMVGSMLRTPAMLSGRDRLLADLHAREDAAERRRERERLEAALRARK